jgi:hypothetical protein
VFPIPLQKGDRQTGGLFSEKKETFFWIVRLVVTEGCLFGAQIELLIAMKPEKCLQTVVMMNIEKVPVVEAGSAHIAVGSGEPQGMDKMKRCAEGGAGSCYVSCILRYFRFDQYNMKLHAVILTKPGCFVHRTDCPIFFWLILSGMDGTEHFKVRKQEKGGDVYFTIQWSDIRKADIYSIIKSVPSMAGVYELYYREPVGALKQLFFSMAWYGGIREKLRRDIDPSLLGDSPIQRAIVERYPCFYRFSLIENIHDMKDLCFFFSRKAPPDMKELPQDSGRYGTVFVKEIDTGKLVTF